METSKLMFLVTRGDYSDYMVCAVFDTRELAQEWIESHCGEGKIEEYPLNPECPTVKDGWSAWDVRLWRNGDLKSVRVDTWKCGSTRADCGEWYRTATGDRAGAYFYTGVFAPDQEHAIKVANERRAISIARGECPNE
jgi:hypothetical protein